MSAPGEGGQGGQGGRRQEILDLFVELVAEKGYDGTNLSEVAGRLGISKGTIVHHFTSKDRMLAEGHLRYIRRRLAEAQTIIGALPTAPERLTALVYSFILYQHEDRAATIAFQRETVRFRENEVMAEAQQLRDEYFELLAGVLQAGFDDGSLRAPRHGDARLERVGDARAPPTGRGPGTTRRAAAVPRRWRPPSSSSTSAACWPTGPPSTCWPTPTGRSPPSCATPSSPPARRPHRCRARASATQRCRHPLTLAPPPGRSPAARPAAARPGSFDHSSFRCVARRIDSESMW